MELSQQNYDSVAFDDLTEKSKDEEEQEEEKDFYDESSFSKPPASSSLMKRAHLRNLIHDLYDLTRLEQQAVSSTSSNTDTPTSQPLVVTEGYMEKLPPGKNLKNSLLLAWRKRFFRLSATGILSVYDDRVSNSDVEPIEIYHLMGGRVEYEPNQRVISLDDGRGNCLVCRCCGSPSDAQEEMAEYTRWKSAIDAQLVDRSDLFWVRPNTRILVAQYAPRQKPKRVLLLDIGTCSIRAGLCDGDVPKLPELFVPTVCSRGQCSKLKVGFEAFDSLLSSSAPSTIDLHKSLSTW